MQKCQNKYIIKNLQSFLFCANYSQIYIYAEKNIIMYIN